MVRLGGEEEGEEEGPVVRKARGGIGDAHDAGCVFLYRDSSVAPLVDLRRRIKAVMDVLDFIMQSGLSLAHSVELTVQLDIGPVYPVTLEDLQAVRRS